MIQERSVIENQRNTILYNQEVVENLSTLESTFASLSIGQDNWFETGHKLSSAYYLVKDHDKNSIVLTAMYNADRISQYFQDPNQSHQECLISF